jgi:general secretion pathway protein G
MSASLHRCPRGFTLVEMLVVAAMLSILALAVVPMAEITQTRWKERELRAGLWEIRQAIDAYKRSNDESRGSQGGSTLAQLGTGYPPSLEALVIGWSDPRPGSSSTPRPLLRRIPHDPFAPDGVPAEKSWGLRSYASPAYAPQAGDDVYDVYSLSPRMGSNGIPHGRW